MATHSHAPAMTGGLSEFKSRLPQIIEELPAITMAVATKVADSVAQKAQSKADAQYHGDDNFAIEARPLSNGAGVYADWYWFFGEFGTVHEAARPFMVPALEESYGAIYPEAREIFQKGLNVSAFGAAP